MKGKVVRKISLTIGIPAYNEEVNIESLLLSIFSQKQENFILQEIIVYSDGSTDNTIKIIKELQKKFPMVRLIEGKKQRGKIFALNQIFHSFKSDILIVLDGDIGLLGNNFLSILVEAIVSDPGAKLVAAHQIPLRPSNFIGKIIYASFVTWDYIRLSIPGYDHVQNLYGAATAYKGSFARLIHVPKDAKEERLYLYLMAKKTNGFRYSYSAKIVYWPVSSWHDFIKLASRSFGKDQSKLDKIFGFQTSQVYTIPWKYKAKGIIESIYYQHIYALLALALNLFLSKVSLRSGKGSKWEISSSSKKLIEI